MQVWPTRVSYKERIPGKEEPRLGPTGLIGNEQADAVERMARGMDDTDPDVAKSQLITIPQGTEVEMRLCRFMEIDGRTRLGREFAAPRQMVRLDVRFDDVRDPHLRFFAYLEILIDVLLWIHHSATALAPSPEEVRSTARVRLEKLPKDHFILPNRTATSNCKVAQILRQAIAIGQVNINNYFNRNKLYIM